MLIGAASGFYPPFPIAYRESSPSLADAPYFSISHSNRLWSAVVHVANKGQQGGQENGVLAVADGKGGERVPVDCPFAPAPAK